jgi:hypothetical protein
MIFGQWVPPLLPRHFRHADLDKMVGDFGAQLREIIRLSYHLETASEGAPSVASCPTERLAVAGTTSSKTH